MALPSIVTTDYTGLINVSADTFTSQDFQAWIDEEYPLLVREILSDAAYIAIRDSADPLPDKWADAMLGNTYLDDNGNQVINTGLTNIVRYWLYWQWVSEQPFVSTNTGNVQNLNENSRAASLGNNAAIAAKRYNKAVGWLLEELYPFLNQFASVSQAVTNAADLGGGVYQLTVDATTYLQDGDTVTVDSIEYAAANVTATTFDITTTETAFSSAAWYPFQDLKMPIKERVFA